jgi:hypothetical protein
MIEELVMVLDSTRPLPAPFPLGSLPRVSAGGAVRAGSVQILVRVMAFVMGRDLRDRVIVGSTSSGVLVAG